MYHLGRMTQHLPSLGQTVHFSRPEIKIFQDLVLAIVVTDCRRYRYQRRRRRRRRGPTLHKYHTNALGLLECRPLVFDVGPASNQWYAEISLNVPPGGNQKRYIIQRYIILRNRRSTAFITINYNSRHLQYIENR